MNGFSVIAVDKTCECIQQTKKLAVEVNGKTIYGAKIIVMSGFRTELGKIITDALKEYEYWEERLGRP
jgi:hypothetical protein